MPADWNPGTQWVQAFQAGSSVANEGFNTGLRLQQLKSEEALRRIQEQQLAQHMAFQLQQHNMMVDAQADRAKAAAAMQAEAALTPPTITVPAPRTPGMSPMVNENGQPMAGTEGAPLSNGTMQVPNPKAPLPEDLYMKHMFQVDQKWAGLVPGVRAPLDQLADYARIKKERMEMQQAGEAGGPGNVQQVTGAFPGAPTLNVFVPPKGRGAVQLVGDSNLQTKVGDDGRTYERQKDGSWKPLAATPEQQFNYQSKRMILADALKIDASQVNEDGTLKPGAWSSIQKQAQVTPELRTKLENELSQSRQSIAALQEMRKTLRPEDVGVRGSLGSELLDVWLPQVGVPSADVTRMDNRTKLKALSEGMLRQMTGDTRFSNTDRADIKDILPKAGARESYQNAMQTASTLEQIFAKRSLVNANTLGRPAPTWAVGALSRDKLREAVDANLVDGQALLDALALGRITEEEANNLFKRLPKTPAK